MTMIHKPTREEKKIIRECAQSSAGAKRVEINPSTKCNIDHPERPPHMNIYFVSNNPEGGWDDTDLFDNAYSWRDFVKGIEMTPDGRACVDFYVYSTGYDAELKTNVTAYWKKNKLVRVDGTCNGTMWQT